MRLITVKKINMCAYFGRGRNEIKVDYGMKDFYKLYIKEGNPYNLTRSDFSKVWKEFSEKLWKMIIYNNYEFIIPYRLGCVRMKSYKIPMKLDEHGELKTVKLAMDYKSTNEYWANNPEAKARKEVIFLFNEHSDGYQAKILWDKTTCITKNHRKYAFRPSRANKREVAKAIKEHNIKYYE